jgi:hypothetical protein
VSESNLGLTHCTHVRYHRTKAPQSPPHFFSLSLSAPLFRRLNHFLSSNPRISHFPSFFLSFTMSNHPPLLFRFTTICTYKHSSPNFCTLSVHISLMRSYILFASHVFFLPISPPLYDGDVHLYLHSLAILVSIFHASHPPPPSLW